MESNQTPDREQAAAALGLVGAARSDLADRLVTPWWYHPALGGALALLIASFATRTPPLIAAAIALYFVSLVALPRLYRRATGIWVTGLTARRARRWAVALGCTAGVGLVLGLVLGYTDPVRLLGPVVAVAVFVLVQVFGRRFDDELREELRADPEAAFKVEESDDA